MTKFLCLEIAIELYGDSKRVKTRAFIKAQLLRASSSVALNLSEGNARRTSKDKARFINIAFSSLREVQTIIRLEGFKELHAKADRLAAMLYKLQHNLLPIGD